MNEILDDMENIINARRGSVPIDVYKEHYEPLLIKKSLTASEYAGWIEITGALTMGMNVRNQDGTEFLSPPLCRNTMATAEVDKEKLAKAILTNGGINNVNNDDLVKDIIVRKHNDEVTKINEPNNEEEEEEEEVIL